MDKVKDQDSAAPAATDDKKTISLKKTGKNTKVIINPPEKLDPQRGFQERFKVALAKHTVILEKKTEIVLNAKASSAELPEETVIQVYTRGYKTLPLNSNLTREQYAMNRVNSFIAGGAAMVEDCDLLPIVERVGIKGTGGAMRPHIKREKNVYNGKTMFHVVNSKGQVKHSTSDQMQAKKHLAQKYHSYMREEVTQEERGLWDNIHDKRKRIKAGSGERMRKPGSEGAPTIDALKRSAVKEEIVSAVEASSPAIRMQRALERIRQSREASEKRAEELLKPKQPQEKK